MRSIQTSQHSSSEARDQCQDSLVSSFESFLPHFPSSSPISLFCFSSSLPLPPFFLASPRFVRSSPSFLPLLLANSLPPPRVMQYKYKHDFTLVPLHRGEGHVCKQREVMISTSSMFSRSGSDSSPTPTSSDAVARIIGSRFLALE
ncbi:hypothetical protein K443DRAFT_442300 [Laccaria amethystina LaAM-08-1]|uniref:Uncharacterized protein n=1 Tax=Laccaria amethystina LaAM-08-1 TaxID=1095629 RepID=A0A0C9XGH2_9AGAR|nr:hypothetical protein K443DRAFT_442300 [Laccaria amethystina LaAM-08-1]